jgi:hypothetical protein
MNAIQNSNARPFVLFIAGSTLIISAILWKNFPVLIFIAVAPFFALLDFSWSPRKVNLIALVCLLGVVSELALYYVGVNAPMLLYIFLSAGLFATFSSVQRLTQNRLNKFTLVIVFTAVEYLLVKLMIHTNPVFLADILGQKPEWTRWNIFTGYLGTSLWIMATNLLFYQAIFQSKQINILLSLLGLLCIVLPILYSFNLENNAVTKDEVLQLYSGAPGAENVYTLHGELISRTGAWVSILIIIFTLVRIKTKKVAR